LLKSSSLRSNRMQRDINSSGLKILFLLSERLSLSGGILVSLETNIDLSPLSSILFLIMSSRYTLFMRYLTLLAFPPAVIPPTHVMPLKTA